jgi:hypothetical protein
MLGTAHSILIGISEGKSICEWKDNIVNIYQFMKQTLFHHLQELKILVLVLCLTITLQEHHCSHTALISSFSFSVLH